VREILRPGQRLTVIPGVRASEQAREAIQPDRSTDEGSVHRVRRGENLTLIARRFGTTPEAIASANDMGVNKLLQVGDHLIIPPTGVQTSGPPTAASDPVAEPVMHTVRRGETLWHIASLYDTTVEALCALNRISAQATLYPGTRLAVSAN
jgi:LysM repeat protein